MTDEQSTLYPPTGGRVTARGNSRPNYVLGFSRTTLAVSEWPSLGKGQGVGKKKTNGKMRQGRRPEAGFGVWDQTLILLVYLKPKSYLGNSGRATRSTCSNEWIHPGLPGACVFFLGAYKYNPITTLFG